MTEQRKLWPRVRSAATFAMDALGARRQRALLALLGISIGVAAVVTLVSMGHSLQRQAQNDFKAIGTQVIDLNLNDPNMMMFKAKPSADQRSRKRLSSTELLAALVALSEVELISPEFSFSCQREGGRSGGAAQMEQSHDQISAVQPEFAQILGLKLASGRFIHALDGNELWVVLGAKTAQKLESLGQSMAPGAGISLCGRVMRLAGVLETNAASSQVVPVSLDDGVLVSIGAGQRMQPQTHINHFVLRVRPHVPPIEFSARLATYINEISGLETQINTAREVLDLKRTQDQSTTRFLMAMSSLSLLVGSLGTLNVMLMAVLERRGEIGLRMAVGADDLDIGLQFLAESILLGLAGGCLGLVFGLLAAWTSSLASNLPFVVSASSMALAFGISLVVGMAAGLYPALKAAQLCPVEALQAAR